MVPGAVKAISPVIPTNSGQMILVIGSGWKDLHCRVYLCGKSNGKWGIQKNFPAVCGKKGMAWGSGFYPESGATDLQPAKKEGDLKSPVGVFQFGECWGYAPTLSLNSRLAYRQITGTIQGVDDPASRYYNQIVNTTDFQDGTIDWKSYEKMRRKDDLYKWLMVIKHNPGNIPGRGSLIFLHVWKNADSGTAGCTAVAEPNILEIFQWLDKDKHPVLAQLPDEVYLKNLVEFGLPLIDDGKAAQ